MEPEDCLQAGTLLCGGKYRIVKAIGQGGFGITYKAKMKLEAQGAIGKLVVEHDVAVKEFFIASECERAENSNAVIVPSKKKIESIDKYRQKFFNEANNLSRFDHDNIVKVIDIFKENSTAYFVMEYIDGESLESIVEKQGAMSETKAKEVIGQLTKAVDYIHRNKFTHLDIKPANILINESGCLKLIDFGLAKHYDSDGKQTTLGVAQGFSDGFSPVEQYEIGALKSFSPQSDIYSVGATMAYLLTGKVPLNPFKKQLPTLPTTVSNSVKQGIYAAMSYNIEDRPKTIGEFMQMIGGKLQPQKGTLKDPLIKGNKGGPSFGNSTADPNGTKVINGGDDDKKPSKLVYWFILVIIGLVIFFVKDCDGPSSGQEEIVVDTCAVDTCAVVVEDVTEEVAVVEEGPEFVEDYSVDTAGPVYLDTVTEEVKEKATSGYINGHEWVDLGLPSGVKWATCNVGASSPGDYGNYYAWGETTTKSSYTEENSKTEDKKINNDVGGNSKYDVARANWGGSWRMPYYSEFRELIDNCNWVWSSRGGYNGYKVTSKKNGKSIFFPAAGYCTGESLLDNGKVGMYWSSSYYKYNTDLLRFYSGEVTMESTSGRFFGFPIRPVSD